MWVTLRIGYLGMVCRGYFPKSQNSLKRHNFDTHQEQKSNCEFWYMGFYGWYVGFFSEIIYLKIKKQLMLVSSTNSKGKTEYFDIWYRDNFWVLDI